EARADPGGARRRRGAARRAGRARRSRRRGAAPAGAVGPRALSRGARQRLARLRGRRADLPARRLRGLLVLLRTEDGAVARRCLGRDTAPARRARAGAGPVTRARCGIILHPAGHTLSPVLHRTAYAALGLDAEFAVYDVPAGRFGERLHELRREGLT